MKSYIFGIGFEMQTKEQLLATARDKIYTPNPIILQNAKKDAALLSALQSADLCLADGVGIRIAARILGVPLPTHLAGIEFAEALLAEAEKKGLRVYLLGGKPHIAEKAAANLQKKHPKLRICGTSHGYFKEDITPKIAATQPDILFVCLGSPRQEIFIHENLEKTGASIGMGLGGSLDVWSETLCRAPLFFRKLRLEWLFRMLREPRRLCGIPILTAFLLSALSERAKSIVKMHRKQRKN